MAKIKNCDFFLHDGKKHYRYKNPDGSLGGWVLKKAKIGKNVMINEEVVVSGEAVIEDDVALFGKILIKGKTVVRSGSLIKSNARGDIYLLIKNQIISNSILEFWP